MKFGDRYIKFMKDRYGIDELYKFLLLICFVLIIINTFISNNIIRLFEVLLIVIIFYRYMSKNIKLRKKENDKYLEIKDKIIKLFDYNKKKYKDRNTHMYKKCPKCKQKIRLPLKKGKHTVKCPNCGNRFDVACHKDEKIKVEIIK
jgi:Zn-finger domain protein